MNALTPLEQALKAWNRTPDANGDKQAQFDDAVALGELSVFSNHNIAKITRLNPATVAGLTEKKDKTGGRFAPESLPLVADLAKKWKKLGWVEHSAVAEIVDMGTSPNMIAMLTGIPRSTIYSWLKKASQ